MRGFQPTIRHRTASNGAGRRVGPQVTVRFD